MAQNTAANGSGIDYEPLDRDDAPEDGFTIGSVRDLVPEDVTEDPPAQARLYFSEEFTDDEDSERTYVLVLDYPEGVENTVIRMENVPTVHGQRMFRKFLDRTMTGYEVEVVGMVEYLEQNE
jgi:hypothetical protein